MNVWRTRRARLLAWLTNAWKLREEIVLLGYKGCYQRVRVDLHEKRTSPRPVTVLPLSPWTVAGWILRHPDTLTKTEQLQFKAVRARCSELDALTEHVQSFATMLTERLPVDRDAVIAGLALFTRVSVLAHIPWSMHSE
ncbi:hypothetical protein ACFWFI_32120 [Streptomyces sp. NPDC060209]|uniref:hypothetical protein n=1 Tax=Streptomyces sp. NPDC060209 TaxID=3347073 RepID=UPI00365E5B17